MKKQQRYCNLVVPMSLFSTEKMDHLHWLTKNAFFKIEQLGLIKGPLINKIMMTE